MTLPAFFALLALAGAANLTVAFDPTEAANLTVTFDPAEVEELLEGERARVAFNFTPCCATAGGVLRVRVDDERVATVAENASLEVTDDMVATGVGEGGFALEGRRLGLAQVNVWLEAEQVHAGYRVVVLRERTLKDHVYRYGIIVLASLIYLGFGAKINLSVIVAILRRPVAPLIGIACQFLLMPLLGFGVSKLVGLDDVYAFGLLAMSCSPGGGGSNTWAFLLQGDLDLSITMTFFSTIFSLLFMPFWMWGLGRFFLDSDRVTVPYMTIVRSLLTLIVPLLLGVLIRRYLPKVASFLIKVTKPLTLFFILYMLTFGTWVNWYMYVIMGTVPAVIPAACLLPWLGFALGHCIAYFLARLGKARALTVGIETGYQNPSIPIIMLQGNFVQPEGDLGAVMPVATAFFTPIPMYVYYAYLEVKARRAAKGDVGAEEEAGPEEGKEGSEGVGEENEGYEAPKAKREIADGSPNGHTVVWTLGGPEEDHISNGVDNRNTDNNQTTIL